MKKIAQLLSAFILLLTFSCTKSDGYDSSRTISAKINGTQKYFNNIIVEQIVETDYTDYIITAKQKDDNTKNIIISLEKGVPGTESIYYIQYFDSVDFFGGSNPGINTNVSENSNLKIMGTFSGNLDNGSGDIVQMTQGIININL